MARAKAAGFNTLIMTVDVPVASRREQAAQCPAWLNGIRQTGMPRMKLMDSYATQTKKLPSTEHVGYLLRTSPDWDYVKYLRDEWDGPLIVKGVANPDDAARLQDEGVDALWVSNHAGRQFDGGPATIETLPHVRAGTPRGHRRS